MGAAPLEAPFYLLGRTAFDGAFDGPGRRSVQCVADSQAAGSPCSANVFRSRPVLTYHLLQCKSEAFPGHRTGQEALFPLNGGSFGERPGETSVFVSELAQLGADRDGLTKILRGGSGLNETVSPPISVR
jgi:hypothetical protein